MINFILMLVGFTSTSNCLGISPGIQNPSTVQVNKKSTGIDFGTDSNNDTGGNTGQKPPFSQP